jgi:outer membrane protein OmpA-like peptidoglycan-associated protein
MVLFKNWFVFIILLGFLNFDLASQIILGKTEIFSGFPLPITGPALSSDGKKMVFLTFDGKVRKAFQSDYDGIKWSEPEPFDMINHILDQHQLSEIGGFSFSYDGTVLYFHSNNTGNFDIYFSKLIQGKWSDPENFGPPVNTGGNEYSPTFSTNQKTVIFLRDKAVKEKEGNCKELVMYEKDKSGKWQGPQYLPSVFNSGCQETPFLCTDNLTLFFASERADTNKLGKKVDDDGYNIYYTKRLYGNGWYVPAYVDELSTEFNDLSPSLNYTGSLVLSNIKAEKTKNQPQNIYSSDLPEKLKPENTVLLYGKIIDLNSGQPLEARIIVYNSITSVVEGDYSTTGNGSYSVILNAGYNYKIDFFKDGFSHYYLFENTQKLKASQTREFNVSLYDEIKLDLNVYDNGIFYPLSPKITITDSLNKIAEGIKPIEISKGRYTVKLKIGKIYKLCFEDPYFETFTDLFDLRTDVQYDNFEKDIELQVARKKLTLKITNAANQESLDADVVITNHSRNEIPAVSPVKENNSLYVRLRLGDQYGIDVARKGFTYFTTDFNVDQNSPDILDISLDSLNSSTKLVFNNISFESNSAELNSNSFIELNRLAQFILDNNEIVVEISAHTDDIGSDLYNNNLSLKRAQKVVDYLVEQKVPIARLRSRGYGKSMPLVPNTSEANRALNRRVELKIIDNTTPLQ